MLQRVFGADVAQVADDDLQTLASLSARIGSLEKTVQALSGRATSAASAQQMSQLSSRVDKLATDMSQLQQSAGQTTTPTSTTP